MYSTLMLPAHPISPYTTFAPAMSLYSMVHQQQYGYATAPPPPPQRQFSGHGTSSAFSSSANADEDWTKISDLAERRRIQNRIAQRNYRKKLKRRMEDLERRAGEEGTTTTEKQTPAAKSIKRSPSSAKAKTASPANPSKQGQFQTQAAPESELMFTTLPYDDSRERSQTPPVFAYATYPPQEELIFAPSYSSPQQTTPMTTSAEPYPAYFLAPVASTLPPMDHFADAVCKREYAPGDDGMGYMHYGYVPGVELTAVPPPYDHNGPHTPPLSHSFEHSTNCSESSSYQYPATPLSMPGSPAMTQHQ